MYTFTTPEPVNLRVELWAGSITIDATDTHETTVELVPRQGDSAAQEAVDQAKVEQRGSDIDVILPKVKGGLFGTKGEVTATIRVPLTSALRLKTGSADLETDGELGHVQADSGSGDMELDHIADGQLRTGSGDIQVTTVTGALNAKCGSGDLTAGSIRGDADVNTGSGDLVINGIDGRLKAKTGSGDIVVNDSGEVVDAMAGSGDLLLKRVDRGLVKAKTGSGNVTVSVLDGTAVYLDVQSVSGEVTSDLSSTDGPVEGDKTVELHVMSGSGDVVLQRV